MTPETIATIIYDLCRGLGLPIRIHSEGDEFPIPDNEQIVVIAKSQQDGRIWRRSFNEINILVPDIGGQPDRLRLEQLGNKAAGLLRRGAGEKDSETFRFQIESVGTKKDHGFHYVNIRLAFECLNVN